MSSPVASSSAVTLDSLPREPSYNADIDADESWKIPSSVIQLAITGGFVGFILGAKRGGRDARLKYLAANAHRAPTTKQGWYYYMKARNYRMFKSGGLTGSKYAFALGLGAAAYALLDETVGWAREEYLHDPAYVDESGLRASQSRTTWKENGTKWYDGAVAGGTLGLVVGIGWRLPRTIFMRAVFTGLVAGTAESGMQILRDKTRVERMKQKLARDADTQSKTESSSTDDQSGVIPPTQVSSEAMRNQQETIRGDQDGKDKKLEVEESSQGGQSIGKRITSWIPSWGKG